MKLLGVAFLICAAAPVGPKAQTRDPCKGETTADMKQCAARNFKKADDELNKVYRELMSKLADEGHKASLKTAQQTWLRYRDSNCDFEAYLNRGGTIYSVVVSDCMSTMTVSRTKEMKEEIQELEGN
jgi:uncharacterized protein YecT (DUF1311 family)